MDLLDRCIFAFVFVCIFILLGLQFSRIGKLEKSRPEPIHSTTVEVIKNVNTTNIVGFRINIQ